MANNETDTVIDPRLQSLETAKKNAIDDCKILYQDMHKPCTETCMCWGWETSPGWNQLIADLSYQLEALNIEFGKKHHCAIRADQVKSKYGGLRFYYTVIHVTPLIYVILSKPINFIAKFIRTYFDYKQKQFKIQDAYVEDIKTDLTEEEYKKEIMRPASNVNLFAEDGKWWKITHLDHYAIHQYRPTKHRFLWKFSGWLSQLAEILDFSGAHKLSHEDKVIYNYLDTAAQKLVAEAEREADSHCEMCGWQIGTEWSPRCETLGWVSNLCKDCAAKCGRQYMLDGKKMFKGEEVK